MKDNTNYDRKLVMAYALGAVRDAAERRRIQEAIDSNIELRSYYHDLLQDKNEPELQDFELALLEEIENELAEETPDISDDSNILVFKRKPHTETEPLKARCLSDQRTAAHSVAGVKRKQKDQSEYQVDYSIVDNATLEFTIDVANIAHFNPDSFSVTIQVGDVRRTVDAQLSKDKKQVHGTVTAAEFDRNGFGTAKVKFWI